MSIAISHHEKKLAMKTFEMLAVNAQTSLIESAMVETSRRIYANRILANAIRQWKSHTKRLRSLKAYSKKVCPLFLKVVLCVLLITLCI